MSDHQRIAAGHRERLRAELVSAARRAQDRRRRRRNLRRIAISVLAAAAILGGASAAGLARPDPAVAGVEVRLDGDHVELRLVDVEVDPDHVARAARDAGLTVKVRAVPVGPSRVGKIVTTELARPVAAFDLLDETSGGFLGFRLPRGWPHRVVLLLGRPARDGERYRAASDAFAPGEPLACSGLRHGSPRQLAEFAAARFPHLRLRWHVLPRYPGDTPGAMPPGQYVAGAARVSARDVVVYVSPDPAVRHPYSAVAGTASCASTPA